MDSNDRIWSAWALGEYGYSWLNDGWNKFLLNMVAADSMIFGVGFR